MKTRQAVITIFDDLLYELAEDLTHNQRELTITETKILNIAPKTCRDLFFKKVGHLIQPA